MRKLVMVLLSTTFLAGGCGTDDTDEATTTTTAPGITTTTAGDATTTTAADDQSAEPVGPASRDTVEGGGFPSTEGTTALLVDIHAARHDGFERIVFEFDGDDPPGYRVGYLDPPVREDFSGNPVDLAGDAVLEVRVVPGAGFDPMSDDARRTYTGPLRFSPDGTEFIEELARIGDFEAHLTWVAGLSGRAPFAVEATEDPIRLAIDVVPGA